jgi:hypothetical protein
MCDSRCMRIPKRRMTMSDYATLGARTARCSPSIPTESRVALAGLTRPVRSRRPLAVAGTVARGATLPLPIGNPSRRARQFAGRAHPAKSGGTFADYAPAARGSDRPPTRIDRRFARRPRCAALIVRRKARRSYSARRRTALGTRTRRASPSFRKPDLRGELEELTALEARVAVSGNHPPRRWRLYLASARSSAGSR